MEHNGVVQITVKPNTYIFAVVLLFLVPLPWLCAWLIAAVFHEFCHWGAVRLCGGRIYTVSIGLSGAVMESNPLTDGKALFAVLSGPLGGFLLVLLGRWLPRVSICSWLLSVYNLLPLLPLDGGRAMRMLLKNDTCFQVAQRLFLFLLSLGAIYAAFALHIGPLPLLIAVILWVKNRKTPCKETVCKVQ